MKCQKEKWLYLYLYNYKKHTYVSNNTSKYTKQNEREDWTIRVVHIYREANQCAYGLVNIGCDIGTSEIVFDASPPSLGHVLLSNVMGVATPLLFSL